MPIISDMEIIKSALIYGDIRDAFSVISNRKRLVQLSLKYQKSSKMDDFKSFLTSLEDLLKGEISLSDFRKKVSSLPGLGATLDLTGETDEYFESLYYLLELAIDRYDIRYPAYDGKRCDDK
ncbi:MAG: hypothetical protein M1476_04790 [Candidatus Thermoplasmatota archaeon]|nr:hypothetical protein [Candidatus Thermoplasmatota archaeon]